MTHAEFKKKATAIAKRIGATKFEVVRNLTAGSEGVRCAYRGEDYEMILVGTLGAPPSEKVMVVYRRQMLGALERLPRQVGRKRRGAEGG